MQLTIATLVTTRRVEGQSQFQACTIGLPRIVASDVLMKGALQKVAVGARKMLQKWIHSGRAYEIARWLYDPDHDYRLIKPLITLRDRNVRIKTLLQVYETIEGRFGHFPMLDAPPFQLHRGPNEENRIQEVLASWLQSRLKESPDFDTQSMAIEGDAWVEPLDLSLESGESSRKKGRKSKGALVDHATSDGAGALHRVGRCLDALVPNECVLFHRKDESDRLEQLLGLERRQGVLLIGASGVGKSAVLQEVIRRRVAKRSPANRHRKNCWLLSPGRVISGMSYLGQWEQRWLSILKEAYRRDHILYFDDVLGLYTAGMSRDSDMCLADVLKAFVAQYPLRLIFEMTPSALSILRRKDRSLVDTLQPFSMDAMNDQETLRTLVDVQGHIEAREHCFFHPGLLPKIVEYSGLMAPHVALPGRAIDLVHGLQRQSVSRQIEEDRSTSDNATDESIVLRSPIALSGFDLDSFVRERTGLNLSIREGKADISLLRTHLEENVLGQTRATEVMARYAARAVHGVSPSDRPLGVFLFLGPTGVGKTESAKALTHLLFDDETRMIRIDLNEVSSAQAAEELIGTDARPDGRLPTAVRRSPNCVLLLDEIEKAHPDVHDYLLQVIGEGRLSDARGRLVDFRNAFIIMTSNLGSREASSLLGYDQVSELQAQHATQEAFRKAAKQFFRPEFLNRIDEIVIFDRLGKEHMHGIVDLHLKALQQRDGLARRQLYLQVDADAREWLVDQGYDPALGARAIHRHMERQVAQPLADHFASTRIDQPCWIRLKRSSTKVHGGDRLESETIPLEIVSNQSTLRHSTSLEDFLQESSFSLESLRNELLSRHHERGASGQSLSYVDYYACHTAIAEADERLRELKEIVLKAKEPSIAPIQVWGKKSAPKFSGRYIDPDLIIRDSVLADLELAESIDESLQKSSGVTQEETARIQIQRKLAIAKQTLGYVDHPRKWLVQVGILGSNPMPFGPNLNAATYRDAPTPSSTFRMPDVLMPMQLNHFIGTSLTNNQFEVEYSKEDFSYLVVEGTSVYAFIEPLLGTYRVQGRFSFDKLLSVTAKPLHSPLTEAAPNLVDSITPVCLRDLDRGPYPWPQIRGEITSSITDYSTGYTTPLRSDHTFYRWYMDLFVHFANRGAN